MLRNTQGRVTLLVSRQEQGGIEDEEEVRGGRWVVGGVCTICINFLCSVCVISFD